MSITTIRKKLHSYLEVADDSKLKAIYTMVEDDIETKTNDWNDGFVQELENRSISHTNGSTKSYSWEETKKAAISKLKEKSS